MKVDVALEQDDLDAIHDVIFDITESQPDDDEIMIWWNRLTHGTKMIAVQWGAGDTVFRDEMYREMKEYIQKNADEILKELE